MAVGELLGLGYPLREVATAGAPDSVAVSLRRDQRPAVVRVGRFRGFGGGGFAARVHHGAELVEAVGGGEASGGQLPERVLGLLAGEVEDALDVVGEAGSALLEEGAELEGFGAEGCCEFRSSTDCWARAWGSQSAVSRM